MKTFIAFFLSLTLLNSLAWSNELHLSPQEAKKLGFKPVYPLTPRSQQSRYPYKPGTLGWPVTFQNKLNSIGNMMAQFQQYGWDKPYFHAGCDLVAQLDGVVTSPVEGTVEAGYYSYTDFDDGNSQKHWIPLEINGEVGSALYFEVAVVDASGYRFEFHHIDRRSLTPELEQAIYKKQKVKVGSYLGRVIRWPNDVVGHRYDHIHYNIITPNGFSLNCEWVSTPLVDRMAPKIEKVYAVPTQGAAVAVPSQSKLKFRPQEFVVQVSDAKDSSPFFNLPHFIEIQYESGFKFAWDFRIGLYTPNGNKPHIAQLFKINLRTDQGTLSTAGDDNDFLSLIRLPVTNESRGRFVIRVKDAVGNEAQFQGALPD